MKMEKKMKINMIVHHQIWHSLEMWHISNEYGCITLEHYPEPVRIGRDKVKNYICNLSVSPVHRRQGHARELLAKAEEIAREQGYRDVHCEFTEEERKTLSNALYTLAIELQDLADELR